MLHSQILTHQALLLPVRPNPSSFLSEISDEPNERGGERPSKTLVDGGTSNEGRGSRGRSSAGGCVSMNLGSVGVVAASTVAVAVTVFVTVAVAVAAVTGRSGDITSQGERWLVVVTVGDARLSREVGNDAADDDRGVVVKIIGNDGGEGEGREGSDEDSEFDHCGWLCLLAFFPKECGPFLGLGR